MTVGRNIRHRHRILPTTYFYTIYIIFSFQVSTFLSSFISIVSFVFYFPFRFWLFVCILSILNLRHSSFSSLYNPSGSCVGNLRINIPTFRNFISVSRDALSLSEDSHGIPQRDYNKMHKKSIFVCAGNRTVISHSSSSSSHYTYLCQFFLQFKISLLMTASVA
jgi:hypothetical protein